MTREEAVAEIERYAEEAEGGNYHDFSRALSDFAGAVQVGLGGNHLFFIKSYDDFFHNNFATIDIED